MVLKSRIQSSSQVSEISEPKIGIRSEILMEDQLSNRSVLRLKLGKVSRFFWFPVFFTLVVLVIYLPYQFKTLMGDDLILYSESNKVGGYGSTFFGSITQNFVGKYRPVFIAPFSLILDLLGTNFVYYQILNCFMLAAVSSLAALITYSICNKNLFAAFFVGMAISTSRFGYYYVLQILGFMESLALLLMLLSIFFVYQYLSQKNVNNYYIALALFFGCIFTHERYLLVSPFFIAVSILYPNNQRLLVRIKNASLVVGIFLVNLVIKVCLLKVSFLVGAGGRETEVSIDSFLRMSYRSLVNCFGYNSGPGYLSGKNVSEMGLKGFVIALLFAVPALLVVIFAAVVSFRKNGAMRFFREVIVFSSLFFPLILSSSISFRLEFRWLFAPFIVLVTLVAYAIMHLGRNRTARYSIYSLFLVVSIFQFLYFRPYMPGTYFFDGQKFADSVKSIIIDQHAGELGVTTIFIVTNGQTVQQNWYLAGDDFFNAYAYESNFDVRYVETLEDIVFEKDEREEKLYFEIRDGNRVVQLVN